MGLVLPGLLERNGGSSGSSREESSVFTKAEYLQQFDVCKRVQERWGGYLSQGGKWREKPRYDGRVGERGRMSTLGHTGAHGCFEEDRSSPDRAALWSTVLRP